MPPTNAIQLPQIVNSSEQSDICHSQFAQFLGYHFTRRNVNQSRDLETDLISRLEVFSLSKIFNSKSLQFFSRLKELSTDNSFFFCVQIKSSSSMFHLVQLLILLYETAIDDTRHRMLMHDLLKTLFFLDLVMKSIKEKDSVESADRTDAVER